MRYNLFIDFGGVGMIERIERVVCDKCGSGGPEVKNGESARDAAELEGWIHCDGQDFCPHRKNNLAC